MTQCIKISSNSRMKEISHRQYEEETSDRLYSGSALMLAENWEHIKYKLTMTMLDMLDPSYDANIGEYYHLFTRSGEQLFAI